MQTKIMIALTLFCLTTSMSTVDSYAVGSSYPVLMQDSSGGTMAPRYCSILKRTLIPSRYNDKYYHYTKYATVPLSINTDVTAEIIRSHYQIPLTTISQEAVNNPNMFLVQCNTSGM